VGIYSQAKFARLLNSCETIALTANILNKLDWSLDALDIHTQMILAKNFSSFNKNTLSGSLFWFFILWFIVFSTGLLLEENLFEHHRTALNFQVLFTWLGEVLDKSWIMDAASLLAMLLVYWRRLIDIKRYI